MRTFIGGNGVDTTSAVLAYLAASKQLRLADLYLIGEIEDPASVWLTNYESPLAWPVLGTFQPATISRGKITSQVGLKVASMDVTWSPKLMDFGTSLATANPYQLAPAGFYDNRRVRIWRAVMPTPGDANTYGATPWFGGRVADSVVSRGSIKFTINSFLDAINQQTPPNVIEASNALAGYVGATPVLADSETSIATFTVVAPSNSNNILGQCIQPTANKIYSNNRFALGYMVFMAGSSLAGFWSAIGQNDEYFAGGGVHYNHFLTYQSFPWAPTPGDTFYVSTQMPVDQASAPANGFKGFPYVPQPTTAI